MGCGVSAERIEPDALTLRACGGIIVHKSEAKPSNESNELGGPVELRIALHQIASGSFTLPVSCVTGAPFRTS